MNLKERYDVCIIGAGIAGICAAYELSKKSKLSVLLIEQGKEILKRACPKISGKSKICLKCKQCSIMNGFGGAGSFSDGKYNITTEFGGWLSEYLSEEEVISLINYVDSINVSFGATTEVTDDSDVRIKAFRKKALEHDLHLLSAKVKHIGTENNYEILCKMYEYLKDKVDILCDTKVESFFKLSLSEKFNGLFIEDKNYELTLKSNSNGIELDTIGCKYLIVAPGRSGAEWFVNQCKEHGIALTNNQVDIGVRVELPAEVMEDLTDVLYEAKIKYVTKCHNDFVRTFCMNPYGYVVNESVDGLVTVNGHSYSDKSKGSKNTNFAILVSNTFTEPFKDPYTYGKNIAKFANLLGEDIIVQRFGDLMKGRRTTEDRMKKSFVKPTLKATPGDLGLVIPKRQLDDIIEMMQTLDKFVPGTANADTLLYGVEVKFYSAKPSLTSSLEIADERFEDLFAIGDGAGVTRGLSHAGASGIHVARVIIQRVEEYNKRMRGILNL